MLDASRPCHEHTYNETMKPKPIRAHYLPSGAIGCYPQGSISFLNAIATIAIHIISLSDEGSEVLSCAMKQTQHGSTGACV